jgi:NAD(P)-dependent dehydrogenase (short-subunit alcohol dehydrogenase family)
MHTVPQAPLILITGGGRGVGAATARLAAAQGYDVAISFVSNESAAQAVAADVEAVGRRALAVRADSADPEQVAQLFAAIAAALRRDYTRTRKHSHDALRRTVRSLDRSVGRNSTRTQHWTCAKRQ